MVSVALACFSSGAARPSLAAAMQTMSTGSPMATGSTPVPAPVGDPAADLIGQTVTLCAGQQVVFAAIVERADWVPRGDGRPLVILVLRVADRGDGSTHIYLGSRLSDERGRMFDMVSTRGMQLDYVAVAEQYGVQRLSWDSVQSESHLRHVWVFTVAPDVQTLQLAANAFNRCT